MANMQILRAQHSQQMPQSCLVPQQTKHYAKPPATAQLVIEGAVSVVCEHALNSAVAVPWVVVEESSNVPMMLAVD